MKLPTFFVHEERGAAQYVALTSSFSPFAIVYQVDESPGGHHIHSAADNRYFFIRWRYREANRCTNCRADTKSLNILSTQPVTSSAKQRQYSQH